MCNKVAVTSSQDVYERRFGRKFNPFAEHKAIYHANAYAVPGLPVITMEAPNEIQMYEWPLIPHYARNDADAKKYRLKLVNARSDTIFELSSFKNLIYGANAKRCLVMVDGVFESMDIKGVKYPHYIYRKDREPFAFAGIYSHWKNEAGRPVSSVSIITTEPNALFTKIHNITLRMPVILPPEKENNWIQPDLLKDELIDLMVPLEDGIMTAHPVGNRLNRSREFTNEPTILDVYNYDALSGVTY